MDPRTLPKTADGARAAWSSLTGTWAADVERAGRLPEASLHQRVDGEWSFVETLRHLVFATDAWVRRVVLGVERPYHRLGLPPDGDVDVAPWGIDVGASPSLDEVLAVRADRVREVSNLVEQLSGSDYARVCPQRPEPGFPPVTTFAVGFCLDVVINEEWLHHTYAVRDLAVLETT